MNNTVNDLTKKKCIYISFARLLLFFIHFFYSFSHFLLFVSLCFTLTYIAIKTFSYKPAKFKRLFQLLLCTTMQLLFAAYQYSDVVGDGIVQHGA